MGADKRKMEGLGEFCWLLPWRFFIPFVSLAFWRKKNSFGRIIVSYKPTSTTYEIEIFVLKPCQREQLLGKTFHRHPFYEVCAYLSVSNVFNILFIGTVFFSRRLDISLVLSPLSYQIFLLGAHGDILITIAVIVVDRKHNLIEKLEFNGAKAIKAWEARKLTNHHLSLLMYIYVYLYMLPLPFKVISDT